MGDDTAGAGAGAAGRFTSAEDMTALAAPPPDRLRLSMERLRDVEVAMGAESDVVP